MNQFMARLIFCFFAEDTGIFSQETIFTRTIDTMSARDSSNTHEVIGELFRAMNTKPDDRAAAGIPRWAEPFPYVNGELFSGTTEAPRFSRIARSYLLTIGGLDWTQVNPDIFGSMIQAVADEEERGALGMHYTSVPNILKVLNPLFLDDLRAALEEAGDNSRKLLNLRGRMAKIRVFDPACGSGNFLVIAYKELRAIEAEINRRRGEADRRSEITLTNFRGIELKDFPATIARLALIIAEYQCDVLHRGQREATRDFLPLDSKNWITCGNALRLDWLSICPPTGTDVKRRGDDLFGTPLDQAEIDFENECGETYICGNPCGRVHHQRGWRCAHVVRMPVDDEQADEPWKMPPSRRSTPRRLGVALPQTIKVTIADQIYIDRSDLPTAMIAQLVRLAAFQNPEFYRAQAMRLPTFGKPRIVSCAELHPRHVALPRGCLDEVIGLLSDHGATADLDDLREDGTCLPETVRFRGELRQQQSRAFDELAKHDTGVLAAKTAFGKTVVASALIAQRARIGTIVPESANLPV